MKKNSYIAVAFIVLVFGIYAVPKIINRINTKSVTEGTRMHKVVDGKLSYLVINNERRKMPEFAFINQDSLLISNNDYKDKVYVVEFFFTTCPTICPIMNRNMLKIENDFGKRDDFGIASFTIDPEHDQPMILKQYAEDYGISSLNWHLLTTDHRDKVYELSNKGLNIFAEINPNVAGGFEHQGYFALVDKKGYLRSRRDNHGNPIIYYQGTEPKEIDWIKEDIKKLLSE